MVSFLIIKQLSNFKMHITFNSFFIFIFFPSTLSSQTQPDLTQVFSGITNCDLHLIISVKSGYSFTLFLPTTLFSDLFPPSTRTSWDVSQMKPGPCRIIYSDMKPVYRFHFDFHPYRFGEYDELNRIQSWPNNFPFLFLRSGISVLERLHVNQGIQTLALLRIVGSTKLEICMAVNAFKLVTLDSYSCTRIEKGSNILQTFVQLRQPPTKFFTPGENLAMARNFLYLNPDLTLLKQPRNPMLRWETMISLHLHHIQAVFTSSNATLIVQEHPDKHGQLVSLDLFKNHRDPAAALILTETIGYSFLTCFARDTVTFEFYVAPFQPAVWVGILFSYLSLCFFLSIYLLLTKHKASFPVILYGLGALLEDGIPLPAVLEKKTSIRILLGGWILTTVILTNCYNGLMITGLNSPLVGVSVTNFRDLVCSYYHLKYPLEANEKDPMFSFDYFSYALGLYGKGEPVQNPYFLDNCFALLSVPVEVPQLPEFFMLLFSSHMDFIGDSVSILLSKEKRVSKLYDLELNLFSPRQRHFPQNTVNLSNLSYAEWVGRVEEEVVRCGKTVQVLQTKLVQSEMSYLGRNYPTARFTQSHSILQPSPEGIILRNSGSSRIPRDYKSFMETGIYGRLVTELYARKHFGRKAAGEWKPVGDKMTMDGCIATLFMICGGIAGLAGGVFCGEVLRGRVVANFRKSQPTTLKCKPGKPNKIRVTALVGWEKK